MIQHDYEINIEPEVLDAAMNEEDDNSENEPYPPSPK
jgi:hypothetical protein